MNKQELQEWIKSAKKIDIAHEDYDEDNHHLTKIYEKDGQLYRINFCNGEANPKWGKSGWESERDAEGKRIKDACNRHIYIYEPIPVKAYPQITVKKEIIYVAEKEHIPLPILIEGLKGKDLSEEDKDIIIEKLGKLK